LKDVFTAQKITDTVYWVGAIDWGVRDFHGYATYRGTTYNAYLVLADTVTLIDTVKAPFKDELLARIASVIDPKKISVIVSNHSEMDHSGCLRQVIETVGPDKVIASRNGKATLDQHFDLGTKVTAIEDGETLDLGNRALTFVETKMVHWPDSMVSYLAEEKLLFSQDAFGMHLATHELFADRLPRPLLEEEAAKYFANILMPLAGPITKALDKIGALELELKIVATDHGPIWRRDEDIEWILSKYADWCAQAPRTKAVVMYDTMWGSTERMARAIVEGLKAGGAEPKLMPLRGSHRSDIATEVLEAGALIVGSPTLNGMMFPTVADVLTYLQGLKPKNLVGAAFGSYGWAPAGVRQVQERLEAMNVDLVGDGLTVKYVPTDEDLQHACALGRQVAGRLVAACG